MVRPAPSLKARAVALLARREYSRAELRERLLGQPTRPAASPAPTADEVDAVLDALQAQGWQDDARAVEQRLTARAGQWGVRRLSEDLRRRGLALSEPQVEGLQASERLRAREVWRRRFGTPPADARERARQWRFLMARGFSASAVAAVLGAAEPDDIDPWVEPSTDPLPDATGW